MDNVYVQGGVDDDVAHLVAFEIASIKYPAYLSSIAHRVALAKALPTIDVPLTSTRLPFRSKKRPIIFTAADLNLQYTDSHNQPNGSF